MGWFFTINDTRADVIRDRIKDRQYTCDDGSKVVEKAVAHCIKGRVLWIVWDIQKEKPDGSVVKDGFIECDLIGKEKGFGAGYKDMCESMHPRYYSCPLSYLDMAPVACEDWREGVREYHAKRAAQRNALKVGQTVPLIDGITVSGVPIKEVVIKSLRPLICSGGPFHNIRLRTRHVKV